MFGVVNMKKIDTPSTSLSIGTGYRHTVQKANLTLFETPFTTHGYISKQVQRFCATVNRCFKYTSILHKKSLLKCIKLKSTDVHFNFHSYAISTG